MNDILKQRLVGALILIALGVVFWPIIFVEPGDKTPDQQGRIPPRPMVDTSPIPAPSHEDLRSSPVLESQQAEDDLLAEQDQDQEVDAIGQAIAAGTATLPAVDPEPQPRTEAPAAPALDSQGVPVAWILQVASVSSADKAEELRDRLLAINEKAYVKRLERGNKVLYRVYIGPKFEKAQLEKMRTQVDTRFGVTSMIVRYLP